MYSILHYVYLHVCGGQLNRVNKCGVYRTVELICTVVTPESNTGNPTL